MSTVDLQALEDHERRTYTAWEEALKALPDDPADERYDDLLGVVEKCEQEHTRAAAAAKRGRAFSEIKAASRAAFDPDPEAGSAARVIREPLTYQPGSHSVFRDILMAERGNLDAIQRLDKHTDEMRTERVKLVTERLRAMGTVDEPQHEARRIDRLAEQRDLSSTDAAGGYLVAPAYLQNDLIEVIRASRAAVNAIGVRPLPEFTDTLHIPAFETGTAVAVQSADGAAIQDTDATFGTRRADVLTIAGMQDVSRQVVDRGQPATDTVIFGDLSRDYAAKFDQFALNSSTANALGILQVSGVTSVTYTDADPTLQELVPKLAEAVDGIGTNLFLPADVFVIAPRRWAWSLAAKDSTGRPLVSSAVPQNAAGLMARVGGEGVVGTLLGNIPAVIDGNMPTTLGSTTSQDPVIALRTSELMIWEDPVGPYLERFDSPGSATLTVRFRLHNYVAQMHDRRPKAISKILGTGLTTPSFA